MNAEKFVLIMMKIIRRLLIFALLSTTYLVKCQDTSTNNEPKLLSVDDFENRFNMEVYALLIDVRLKVEYRKERIKNPVNVPSRKNLDRMVDTLDHETPLYLYCTSNTRSISAGEYLKELGFANIYVLEKGIRGWKEAGKPVNKGRVRRD